MIIALLIAVIFMITVNIVQSNIGIFPKLARAFHTKIDFNEKVPMWSLEHCRFVNKSDYKYGNNFENHPWLIIKPLETGLFIKQSRILNLFPKKLLIPWGDITFIEKRGILKKQFVFQISFEKKIYIISKLNLLDR